MSEPVPDPGARSASKSRRTARVCALQALYMIEVGQADGPTARDSILALQPLDEPALSFFEQEVEGVWINLSELDPTIEKFLAKGWSLDRLAVMDRIVLRLAVHELYHLPGMPPKVTISEAVELAKRFGTAESGRFVNGVLASILSVSPKAAWDPSMEELFPEEPEEPEETDSAPQEEAVEEGSAEHGEIMRAGPWVIKNAP